MDVRVMSDDERGAKMNKTWISCHEATSPSNSGEEVPKA